MEGDEIASLSIDGKSSVPVKFSSSSCDKPNRVAIIASLAQSCSFRFNDDNVSFIKKSKVLFIMRGLPGSGKSTVVKQLKQCFTDAVVCSADDFFCRDDGTYHRDDHQLSDAHSYCQSKAAEAISENKCHVIIDNTNIRQWEMKHYFGLANHHGYIVLMIVPSTPWAFNPVVLALKNIHGVPIEHIQSKLAKFDEVIPYYWGWSLNGNDSSQLKALGVKYFTECVLHIEEFSQFLPVTEQEANSNSFGRIYGSKSPGLHCTAFYAGRRKQRKEVVQRYAHCEVVKNSVGMLFRTQIIGILFTSRTAGARVLLSSQQQNLFAEDDGIAPLKNISFSTEHWSQLDCNEMPSHDVLFDRKTVSEASARDGTEYGQSRGSKAHITLGYSAKSQAVDTGVDLLDVNSKLSAVLQTVKIDDEAIINYYGNGQCMVCFSQPLVIDTMFSTYY